MPLRNHPRKRPLQSIFLLTCPQVASLVAFTRHTHTQGARRRRGHKACSCGRVLFGPRLEPAQSKSQGTHHDTHRQPRIISSAVILLPHSSYTPATNTHTAPLPAAPAPAQREQARLDHHGAALVLLPRPGRGRRERRRAQRLYPPSHQPKRARDPQALPRRLPPSQQTSQWRTGVLRPVQGEGRGMWVCLARCPRPPSTVALFPRRRPCQGPPSRPPPQAHLAIASQALYWCRRKRRRRREKRSYGVVGCHQCETPLLLCSTITPATASCSLPTASGLALLPHSCSSSFSCSYTIIVKKHSTTNASYRTSAWK